MRLKTAIWVAAYLRRCNSTGMPAVLRRRGAEEAGAIFVKIDRLDGTADLFTPAPQAAFAEAAPADRAFIQTMAGRPSADVEARLAREIRFDSDLWILEVESRDGQHLLEIVAG